MLGGLDELRRRLGWWMPVLVLLACSTPAVEALITLVPVLASRLDYPMDIEWMEGGALLHAHRLLRGEPLYPSPAQGFIPYPYPPGHYIGLALLSLFRTLDYDLGRALSLGFLILACGMLVHELMLHYQRTDEALVASLLAIGLIAVGYPVVGGWYDIIRNDSMALGLVVAAAAILGDGRASRTRVIVSALLLTAAVYTKQTNALFALWLCAFQLLRSWPRGLWLASVTGVACALLFLYAQLTTGGWFMTYIIVNLARHAVVTERARDAMVLFFEYAPYVVAIPVLIVLVGLARSLRARTVKWVGMFFTALPASLLPFMKMGGFLNNLMPMIVLVAPTIFFLVADVLVAMRRRHWAPAVPFAFAVIMFAAAGQLIASKPLAVDFFRISREQRQAALELNRIVSRLKGGVLIPSHPFLAVRNGEQTPQIHEMGYQDTLSAGTPGLDLGGFLARTPARWAILSGSEASYTTGFFHLAYERHSGLTLYVNMLTGYRSSPRLLMKRREPIHKRDPHIVFDFENGLDGWTTKGDAFAASKGYLSSWNPERGDAARGTAMSPPFEIDRDYLEIWIGGGMGRMTRIELIVDGQPAHATSGFNTGILTPVMWNVHDLRSQQARLYVIDEATDWFGHIILDSVTLFDR